MTLLRCALAFGLVLGGLCGCETGAPERASDIQHLNAISDDISAVRMTEPPTAHAQDPNQRTTLPHHYGVSDIQ